MRWISFDQLSSIETDRSLPLKSEVDITFRPCFIFSYKSTNYLIAGNTKSPIVIFDESDFDSIELWQLVLSLYKVSMVEAAQWWKKYFAELSPGGLMQAFGLAQHHRSVSDWREMSELGESATELHRNHDLPLNILRLWNRLSTNEQKSWNHIFELRQIKKNLIREIIIDYYDLSVEARKDCLKECTDFAENWQAKSSVFPAQELRDRVHRNRYPQYEALRKELFALRKELSLPKEIQLDLPADLESGYLQLKVELKKSTDVSTIAELLSDKDRQQKLIEIIQKI
ncbi:MAG: hypothetical protein H3C43_02035 [Leptonema sp. (in: Bacteria)]|nr:hypothetical protein [Leptonema sp. (in: bacteria)]